MVRHNDPIFTNNYRGYIDLPLCNKWRQWTDPLSGHSRTQSSSSCQLIVVHGHLGLAILQMLMGLATLQMLTHHPTLLSAMHGLPR